MSNQTAIPENTALVRQEFGAIEYAKPAELAAHAAAAHARALIEARCVLARDRPRDLDDVRVRLLREAKRPGFAAVARYRRPVGGGKHAEGPSIRFAEAAARTMGNLYTESVTVFDDDERRIVRVSVMDLETNATFSRDVTIAKVMERRSLREGDQPISSRVNSQGAVTYLIPASEDGLRAKEAAENSRVVRTLILRLVPGDIVEEVMTAVLRTLATEDAKDPDAARKLIADGFAAIGVRPSEVKEHLGIDLGACSPTEMAQLRAIYVAIRDGETTWREVSGAAEKPTGTKTTAADRVKAKAAEARASLGSDQREAEKHLGEHLRGSNREQDEAEKALEGR